MRWYLTLLEHSSYERSFVLHLAYRERSAAEAPFQEGHRALSIRAHHVPGMQNRALTIIQPVNHKVHMEYKYSKTLLGTPTPLPGQTCAIIVQCEVPLYLCISHPSIL